MKIKLNSLSDDDPLLDHSKLLCALERTIQYANANNGIGLTKSKAFNKKFAHWAAENFGWPEYSADELLSIQKVLNEEDVPPVMVVHDLMQIMKFGRHVKGNYQLSKKANLLAAHRGKLFALLADTYLFQYNHMRMSRFDFVAMGNWDIFLNIINVEAEQGLTEAHLVKTLYGLEQRPNHFDRECHAHASFLYSHVLRPLCWMGFLDETRESNDFLAKRIYWKTPFWQKCLKLSTDHQLKAPTLN